MGKINVDYIGVVRETEDKKVSYIHATIENEFQWLIDTMNEMVEKPEYDMLDIQEYVEREFEKSQRGFNYCYPYSYYSSYVNAAFFPKSLTYQEYKNRLFRSSNQLLKRNYVFACTRFIYAFCYYRKLRVLKQDNNNKMFSTENIGWTGYTYEINNDIKIDVNTNFGYGMSSYFFVNVKYKNIDILPYSMTVCYYKARMADFIRYTRMYNTVSESWDLALDFVTKTSNEAIASTDDFIKKWIVNEIDTMMSGLKHIASNPHQSFNNLICNRDTKGLISIRNINQTERELYKIYPNEMIIAKQAEKISGALNLLNKLETLIEIYPKVIEDIQIIKDLNRNLLPSFSQKVSQIKAEVVNRQTIIDSLKIEKEDLEQKCRPHNEKILEIKKESENEKGSSNISEAQIREDYCKEHIDFKYMIDRIAKIEDEIIAKEKDIINRNEFAKQIEDCIDAIESKLQLSA